MFASAFHRVAFFFALACVAVWFYVLREWWGTIAALALCLPVGVVFSFAPAMLVGSIRQLAIRPNDAVLTWALFAAGVALAVYAFIAHDGTEAVLIALGGIALVVGGIQLFYLRLNAMRLRAAYGEADEEDAQFLRDIGQL